jgi:3D (Asp-Asp-Asp) domain-containing protein
MADRSFQRQDLSISDTTTASTATRTEDFEATAYCVTGITKSGAKVVPGHVAADPKVIPLGSMIYVDSPFMGGIYQVLDTGEMVKGKIIDIFIPSYERCVEFGRRGVKVQVLRYGFLGHAPESKSQK